jgi:hypothetical protein
MANVLIGKIVNSHNQRMEEILSDIKTEIEGKNEKLYKSLKEEDDVEDDIIEKIRMNNIKRLEDFEKKFKEDIQNFMFEYSKNICSALFTFILDKKRENWKQTQLEILNDINEIGEDDLKMDGSPFINNDMSDLISSITSDSSVYENGGNQEYFNKFNAMVENMNFENNSDNETDETDDSDSDNDENVKEHLETMNMAEIKDLAKNQSITLSKRVDGSSKKKTKDELIEELLLKIN